MVKHVRRFWPSESSQTCLNHPANLSLTSLVRPFAISLMCAMAAIGQAPVWLHVASCDHQNHPSAFEPVASEGGDCFHDCCHHSAPVADDSGAGPPSETPSHSHGDHDSDSCVICQTLAAPNGVAWKLDMVSAARWDGGIACLPTSIDHESISLSIPQPRGPPAQPIA